MVDVIKSLGFEYVCANPGSSFRGLHESIVNYGGNKSAGVHHLLPRRIVGGDGARLRQDRRQADGGAGARHRRPAARVDGDLQRLLRPRAGLHRRSATRSMRRMRRPGVEWDHSVQDAAAMVRDFIKWDDTPVSLHALRRIRGARLQDRDDAADDAGAARRRRRSAGETRSPSATQPAHSEADARRRRRRATPAPWPKRRGCWSPPRTR